LRYYVHESFRITNTDFYTEKERAEISKEWPDLGREKRTKGVDAKFKRRSPRIPLFDNKPPTEKQTRLLLLLDPYRRDRCYTYAEVAGVLGISVDAVRQRMANLKKRCPHTHADFKESKAIMAGGKRAVNCPMTLANFDKEICGEATKKTFKERLQDIFDSVVDEPEPKCQQNGLRIKTRW